MNSKERCLAALEGKTADHVPVFPLLMFLAVDRAGISYREFATNCRAMAEAQLKMREQFGLDAITACSDAFRVSGDLGGEMVYPETKPPYVAKPIVRSASDLDRLPKPDPCKKGSRMADRASAVAEMAAAVGDECLVLGWIEMPFAEACAICGVTEFMMLMVDNPPLAHRILGFVADIEIAFARCQLESGAAMIGAGDAAASLVSPPMFREFVLPYEQRVSAAIHEAGGLVKLHICGNTSNVLSDLVRSGADLVNIDHAVDFKTACDVFGSANICFKGNLDPVADMLDVSAAECERRVLERLRLAEGKRYMLSAGREVPAGVSDEVLHAFCNAPAKYARTR